MTANPPDYEGSRGEMLKILADNDMPPAFIERARRTEAANDQVIQLAKKERYELLDMSRLRLGVLAEMIRQDWSLLKEFIEDDSIEYLRALHSDWKPQLRVEVSASNQARRLKKAITELIESFSAFNRKWKTYVELEANYFEVNELREGYNKFYVVEKAAAFDSERLARDGFVELAPFTADELLQTLPYLKLPKPKEDES